MKKSEFDKFVLILLISYVFISNLKSFFYESDKHYSQFVSIDSDNNKDIQQDFIVDFNVAKIESDKDFNMQFSKLVTILEDHYLNKLDNKDYIFVFLTNKDINYHKIDLDKNKFIIDKTSNNIISNEETKIEFYKNNETKNRLKENQCNIIRNYLIENSNFLIRCANKQECVIDIPFLGRYGIFDIIDQGVRDRRIQNFIIQFAHKQGINEFFGFTLNEFFNILNKSYNQYGYNPITYFAKRIKSCSKQEYIRFADDLIDKLFK